MTTKKLTFRGNFESTSEKKYLVFSLASLVVFVILSIDMYYHVEHYFFNDNYCSLEYSLLMAITSTVALLLWSILCVAAMYYSPRPYSFTFWNACLTYHHGGIKEYLTNPTGFTVYPFGIEICNDYGNSLFCGCRKGDIDKLEKFLESVI